tara:strand:+ start:6870 stop:6998 length:129 start_codon:yes stop_codon:yes gene_type:complete
VLILLGKSAKEEKLAKYFLNGKKPMLHRYLQYEKYFPATLAI